MQSFTRFAAAALLFRQARSRAGGSATSVLPHPSARPSRPYATHVHPLSATPPIALCATSASTAGAAKAGGSILGSSGAVAHSDHGHGGYAPSAHRPPVGEPICAARPRVFKTKGSHGVAPSMVHAVGDEAPLATDPAAQYCG